MRKTFASTILIVFSVFSCYHLFAQHITGNGNLLTKERTVGDFKKVKINGSIDVVLEIGNKPTIDVMADENLQDIIITEVTDNTLIISTKEHEGFSSRNKTEVHVWRDNLEGIAINGSGDVTGKGKFSFTNMLVSVNGSGDVKLDADASSLSISINGSGDVVMKGTYKNVSVATQGSGDVKLEGKSDNLTFKSHGSGDLSATDFMCNEVSVTTSGSGDATVYAVKSLVVETSGSGDVAYKGSPESKTVMTKGSGECHKMN